MKIITESETLKDKQDLLKRIKNRISEAVDYLIKNKIPIPSYGFKWSSWQDFKDDVDTFYDRLDDIAEILDILRDRFEKLLYEKSADSDKKKINRKEIYGILSNLDLTKKMIDQYVTL